MNLRPIKDRILIKPELPATTTASGIILAEQRTPEQTGTVVAVGPCEHPRKAEAEFYADWLERSPNTNPQGSTTEAADLLRDLVRKQPAVKVGDYVIFSWTTGQEIWVEDGEERYLLMREDDILCVVDGLAPDLPDCGDGASA